MEYHGALYGTYSADVPILDGEEEGEDSVVFSLPSMSTSACVQNIVSVQLT